MFGRVTRRASRIGLKRVKLVFSIVITELIVPKNTKIKQGSTLSICFEKGGKVSSTRSFPFDLDKNTVNPLNVNMPCVAIPINEKVELVATLYRDPSTGKFQAKEGKILLRKLKRNAIAGIDAFKGIGIHALQLHELATELGFDLSMTKECELPFSRLDHSSIKATVTTRFLRELNADDADESLSQFSMLSDASDLSTLGATFRYDDLEGVSKKAGMGDERFMGITNSSTNSTPLTTPDTASIKGRDSGTFLPPLPLGSIVTSGNAILTTPLKRKSGTGFTPRTGPTIGTGPGTGRSSDTRTPSPAPEMEPSEDNISGVDNKRRGSGQRIMELHKAHEDAAAIAAGLSPRSPRSPRLSEAGTTTPTTTTTTPSTTAVTTTTTATTSIQADPNRKLSAISKIDEAEIESESEFSRNNHNSANRKAVVAAALKHDINNPKSSVDDDDEGFGSVPSAASPVLAGKATAADTDTAADKVGTMKKRSSVRMPDSDDDDDGDARARSNSGKLKALDSVPPPPAVIEAPTMQSISSSGAGAAVELTVDDIGRPLHTELATHSNSTVSNAAANATTNATAATATNASAASSETLVSATLPSTTQQRQQQQRQQTISQLDTTDTSPAVAAENIMIVPSSTLDTQPAIPVPATIAENDDGNDNGNGGNTSARYDTDDEEEEVSGEVQAPSVRPPAPTSAPKQPQQVEVISLSRKELVSRANKEAFELYQKELNARAARITELEKQLVIQATKYKAEIMTLKTELNTVHADLHMRMVLGYNNNNSNNNNSSGGGSGGGGSYAAWRDRSVSAAARRNVWGSAVIHDESDEDAADRDCSGTDGDVDGGGGSDGIAAAAVAAVRDSEDLEMRASIAGPAASEAVVGIAEEERGGDGIAATTATTSAGTPDTDSRLPPVGRRGSNTELLQARYANFSRRNSAKSLLSPKPNTLEGNRSKIGSTADKDGENNTEDVRSSSMYFNNEHIGALRAVAAAAMADKASKEEKATAAAAAAVEVAAATLSAAAKDGDSVMEVLLDAAATAGTRESVAAGILQAHMSDAANEIKATTTAATTAATAADADATDVAITTAKAEESVATAGSGGSGKQRVPTVSFSAATLAAAADNNIKQQSSSSSNSSNSNSHSLSLTRSAVLRNPAAEEAVADLVAEYGKTTAELEMMAQDLYFYKELADKAMIDKAEETMAAREAATAAVEANMRRAVVEEEYRDMSDRVVQLMMQQGRLQVQLKEEKRKKQALKNRVLQYAEKVGAMEVRYSNVDINDILAATAPSPCPSSPMSRSRAESTVNNRR